MTAPETADKAFSDNHLMKAYVHGSAEAFDELYRRYKQPLYQFILNGCGNPALAAEVFQDIWISVVKARSSYQSTGTFKSWLYRIARNKLIDFYRRNAKHSDVESYEEESAEQQVTTINAPLNPTEIAELRDDQNRIREALKLLPWKQREAVMLKYIAGFSLLEIAEAQGDAQETVKSRLRYAYTKLRQQLRANL